jgi:hypothetical protein
MSRAAITLGTGHPPHDLAGGTVLDVHLHPDAPEGPLSLGEQWGFAPGVGAQFTLQKAAEQEAEHLRACDCDWLVLLAVEERKRGRLFSPQEILARRPPARPAVAMQSKPVKSTKPARETFEKARAAMAAGDFQALEELRDELTEEVASLIAAEWSPVLPWPVKDACAALLQDQTAECVHPIFRDALKSPAVETRAFALCVLTGDFSQFTSLLTDGWVDAAKVDAAIRAARLNK